MPERLTQEQAREAGRVALTSRGTFNAETGKCTLCGDTPESHINPVTQVFMGCGAAYKLSPQPWLPEGRYQLAIEDFPKQAIRSHQERIAYSVVKALHRSGRPITSAAVAFANPTWTVRDSYRLLQALTHRGILNRIPPIGEEEVEVTELLTPWGPAADARPTGVQGTPQTGAQAAPATPEAAPEEPAAPAPATPARREGEPGHVPVPPRREGE